MGTGLLSGHYSMRLKPNQIMFTSLGLGEMGYGLPGAIGASKAYPGRQIICLNCDGGMMMNLQELQTIIHHKMNIKIVVFNNDGYLMIKHTQNMLFKGHKTSVDSNTGLSLPDYIKVGNSFGFGSWSLNNWSNFENTIKEWLSSNNPTLLEVYMDPNQEFLPKVKGIANEDGTITPASLEEMSPILPYKDIEDAMIAGVSENSKKIRRPN
jgi:acetolactate synthase-1/2/3 large subunit